jgi:hypothetical protein
MSRLTFLGGGVPQRAGEGSELTRVPNQNLQLTIEAGVQETPGFKKHSLNKPKIEGN